MSNVKSVSYIEKSSVAKTFDAWNGVNGIMVEYKVPLKLKKDNPAVEMKGMSH